MCVETDAARLFLKSKKEFPIVSSDGRCVKIPDDGTHYRVNAVFIFEGFWIRRSFHEFSTSHSQYRVIGVEVLTDIEKDEPREIEKIPSEFEAKLRIVEFIRKNYFREILEKCGAMVTGSQLLQLVHCVEYTDSDIDIFCPVRTVLKMQSYFLSEQGCSFVACRGTSFDYSETRIKMILDLLWHGKKLQIIAVDSDNISEYIDQTFDFSFCKIRSDGVNVYPNNLRDILLKKGLLNLTGGTPIERVRKYADRGYRFHLALNGERI